MPSATPTATTPSNVGNSADDNINAIISRRMEAAGYEFKWSNGWGVFKGRKDGKSRRFKLEDPNNPNSRLVEVSWWDDKPVKNPTYINDGIITPSGKVVKPDSQDFHLLMKQGGDVQRMLGGSQSDKSNSVRSVNVSGSLYLNTDGQSVDLVELINRNPEAFYRVASDILFPKHGQSRVNG